MRDLLELERKFCSGTQALELHDGVVVQGYASLFGVADKGGDIVTKGAYARSLAALAQTGRSIKMLWQHDPAQPIGVWDEVCEDGRGLFVKGRLLNDLTRGREAATMIEAGVIDGLSIGYRCVRAERNTKGQRMLHEVELWEVSLVTFPMLPEARVDAKMQGPDDGFLMELADLIRDAGTSLAR